MKLLWLAWKDPKHPAAGGAEVVLWQLSLRLVRDGHEVAILTCGYDGALPRESINGVDIIRVGRNRYLHSFQALLYYLFRLRNRYDVMVETVNTAPYFAVLFGGTAKRFLLYHQLAREIWHYETKAPLNWLGYHVLEPLATRLLGRARVPTITVSESTRRDLLRYGFRPELVKVMSEGIELTPLARLTDARKFSKPTLLSLGALRPMKRTLDQVAAFEIAKRDIPDLKLKIAGSLDDPSGYGEVVLRCIAASPFVQDIECLGRVSQADKVKLMRQCQMIMVTSLKEGWGLIVTEAASQGTPAAVYDVDGLRDSVRDGQTGRVTAARPAALAEAIVAIMKDRKLYHQLRTNAWQWSKEITFDQAYNDFKQLVGVTA